MGDSLFGSDGEPVPRAYAKAGVDASDLDLRHHAELPLPPTPSPPPPDVDDESPAPSKRTWPGVLCPVCHYRRDVVSIDDPGPRSQCMRCFEKEVRDGGRRHPDSVVVDEDASPDQRAVEHMARVFSMLDAIPEHPRYATSRDLATALGVTQRSVQRELLVAAQVFPLVVNRISKPFGWSWPANGKWRR